jgi:hypothetical protein
MVLELGVRRGREDIRAKEKMVPADWAPKMTEEKQTKNWKRS